MKHVKPIKYCEALLNQQKQTKRWNSKLTKNVAFNMTNTERKAI